MSIASVTRVTQVVIIFAGMTMTTKAPRLGPPCGICSASSVRAVRTRSIPGRNERVYYIAFLWTCSVCDNAWIDDLLEQANSKAANAARAMANRRAFVQAMSST